MALARPRRQHHRDLGAVLVSALLYIYAIVDEFGTPRYVGQTSYSLRDRLFRHQAYARTGSRPLDVWLRSCADVTIVPLEAVTGQTAADEAERRWIRQMREGNVPLLNIADGGRRAKAGWHQSDEAKRRIGEARRGKPLSAEHRAKLSAAHTGVPLGAEHRAAIARGGKQRRLRSPEVRARMSQAAKQRWARKREAESS